MNKLLILLILFSLGSLALTFNRARAAEEVPDLIEEPDVALVRQTGKLFTVEFSKMGHHIVVRTAGKEAAVIDGRNISIYGHAVNGAEVATRTDLHFVKDEKAAVPKYNILDPLAHSTSLEVDVKDNQKGEVEHFKFNLN